MPADRSYGMDHPHYEWSALPERPPLRWPDGATLAVGALVLLEHYEWDPPPTAYGLRSASGGLIRLPAPDYVQLTHREYGHRVGIFRVLDTLERHGVPPTVAVDALTAQKYPWLVEHCVERGCEIVAHGVAASRLITSKMSRDEEVATIVATIEAISSATGKQPSGWYSPEGAESERTPALVAAAGITYLCDWPNDEQPYPMTVPEGEMTALPLFLEVDDEFALWNRRASLDSWQGMIVDAGRRLAIDGRATGRLLMLTLRPWLIGQPFRIAALDRALAALTSIEGVWTSTAGGIVDAAREAAKGA